jgi:hypothetical protein
LKHGGPHALRLRVAEVEHRVGALRGDDRREIRTLFFTKILAAR